MVILDTDVQDYFLDRVVEGIRIRPINFNVKTDAELKSKWH